MFTVTIDRFNGPLDLMLHLIKERKLDLFNLDISELTHQYQLYIMSMQTMNLEIASEYLTELAGLIEFKSRKLLPKDESLLDSDYQEDPQESLIKRLLEYKQFKEVSSSLQHRYEMRQQLFSKPFSKQTVKDIGQDEIPYSADTYDLIKAMRKVMQRMSLSQPFQTKVTPRELSVDDRMDRIRKLVQNQREIFLLDDLFADCDDIQMLIVTFLAVLDLIRMGELNFSIDEDRIWLKRSELSYEISPFD